MRRDDTARSSLDQFPLANAVTWVLTAPLLPPAEGLRRRGEGPGLSISAVQLVTNRVLHKATVCDWQAPGTRQGSLGRLRCQFLTTPRLSAARLRAYRPLHLVGWAYASPSAPLWGRRGVLSADLKQAIRAQAGRPEEVGDDINIVLAVGNAFAALDAELERIAKVRLRAVRRLRRQGWSYERIAAASGLSNARVAQLSKDPRHS